MKVANIMNFVRYIDERREGSIERQYEVTAKQVDLVNELDVENTFLLQYDAFSSEIYQKLFKEKATDKTEIGLWYEIVEPLTSACNIPYKSEMGWKWDWHIIPGFSMAYTPHERELLADEAMRKFKEVFGYYPKTVASWLIDTHTINYLAEKYDISSFAICRDQVSTDAYTLIGGYFNQAYYPSKNNVFTPAQTSENRVNVPVFRLLGPCPLHNYEGRKYLSEEALEKGKHGICTLEAICSMKKGEKYTDGLFKAFYENENLGFAYTQIGQENSMGIAPVDALRGQIEKVKAMTDVKIEKMCDTGEKFKKMFPEKTPATCVAALENWDTPDMQSVYYDCQKYTANIIRYENRIFIRSLFLFDDSVKDEYLSKVCTTFDAIYENLPLIDTLRSSADEKYDCGLMIDSDASAFGVEKIKEGVLKVYWKDKYVIFDEEKITVHSDALRFYPGNHVAKISMDKNSLCYDYKGSKYRMRIENAELTMNENVDIKILNGDKCSIIPELY